MSEATKCSPSPRPMTSGGPHARGDEPVRLVAVQEDERVDALRSRARARAHRPSSSEPCVARLDEVGDDLGVGLRDEAVTLRGEARLQLEVVLDDAVVDDDDLPAAVLVRVGVLLGGPAVRRPAGVADARSRRRAASCARLAARFLQLARGAAAHDRAVLSTTAIPAES